MRLSSFAPALAVLLLATRSVAGDPTPVEAAKPFGAAERATELDRIAGLIDTKYVYKDKAAAWAAELREMKSDPELLGVGDRSAWAAILTRRLSVHDLHFHVTWSATTPQPARANTPAGARPDRSALERMAARNNYGFETVERLDGNIGYMRLSSFAGFDRALSGDKTPEARRTGEAALRLVANTDAVIFDLRRCGGGSPDMVDLLLSAYFGDQPVLLNRFYMREGDKTTDFTTLPDYAGPRRPDVPVYVLVSSDTASAAEEFAYDIQTRKRGLVVGDTTAGGANPGDRFDAGDGFEIFISTGAAINPITNTNWEGIGVKPDVEVSAAEALGKAHALALQAVLDRNLSKVPVEARWTLEQLKAEQARVRLSPDAAAAYVGTYGDRHVAIRDGTLLYQRRRGQPQRLIPLGAGIFALEDAHARVSFEHDGAGNVATMVMRWDDGDTASYAKMSETR
jgi:hypothetical protein